jgi:hypothetical protein
MTIVSKESRSGPVEIDLTGPDGNAYALMGYASRFAKQLGRDPKPIIQRMTSADYENLLAVFDEEFGEFVTLLR